jgi:hypothetical protein
MSQPRTGFPPFRDGLSWARERPELIRQRSWHRYQASESATSLWVRVGLAQLSWGVGRRPMVLGITAGCRYFGRLAEDRYRKFPKLCNGLGRNPTGDLSTTAPCCPYRLRVWPPPGASFCRLGSSSVRSRARSSASLAAARRSRRRRLASLISGFSEPVASSAARCRRW